MNCRFLTTTATRSELSRREVKEIMGRFADLTGKKFGRLCVVGLAERDKHNRIRWICKCDCGNRIIVSSSHLNSGHTQSCGCLQRERTSEVCKKDLIGQRFGKLVVRERTSKMGDLSQYRCVCDCGKEIIVRGSNLVNHRTKSCGCIRREGTRNLKFLHGQHDTRLYRCWQNMKDRCGNEKNKEYKNYGGRGIKVCLRWQDSFVDFAEWALNSGYDESLTIDRIDVDGNYCPENCRWSTMKEQSRNRTDNCIVEIEGERKILQDWIDETGSYSRAIKKRGKVIPARRP